MSAYRIRRSPALLATVTATTLFGIYYLTQGSTSQRTHVPTGMVSMRERLAVAIQAAEAGGDKVYNVRQGDIEEKEKAVLANGYVDPITRGDQRSVKNYQN